ncbi:FAD-binding oxidoreductase [Nocardioides sp. WL0053]|uniref:D-amino-acid oxidase n=1 Tax=Nocardioides jiangsuensis TaxID=2866161 RepID=A0ABS7RKT9_9ACTN|nr:FAD-dependent oxidoreductase [Nocardioides jiangsuensis]MBY9075658.1 FAD-binding oxidoreductase [Nocardioides jiangsuensis]
MARVIVIGAGVVGLSCALRVLQTGHHVDVVARDLPLETTSATAAALWYPYRAFPYERVSAWSATSFTEFERLAADEDTGVAMVEGTELHRSRTSDPWWSAAVPALTRVRAMPAPYVDGWSFRAPVVEMPVYLRWLSGQVVEAGGTITRMALGGLPDQAEVVVNASGLGARLIGSDPSVLPVRGQVVHVEQFGLDRWWLDGAGPTYVVPRSKDVVVGGTDEEGEWSRTPDPATAARILERASLLVPELAKARVLRHRVGLRPARPRVRLEEERCGDARVVHCYGHGGAGVTLSWGCADEVAALVGPA